MAAAGVLPGFGGVSIHDRYAQYWYFHERGGTTLDQPNLRRRFTRLCKIAGIGKLSPYELRDSAATIPLARGVPLLVVSELLGHSSFRETKDVYGHLVAENSRRAAQAMGKALYGH
jgi:integrase